MTKKIPNEGVPGEDVIYAKIHGKETAIKNPDMVIMMSGKKINESLESENFIFGYSDDIVALLCFGLKHMKAQQGFPEECFEVIRDFIDQEILGEKEALKKAATQQLERLAKLLKKMKKDLE